MSEPQYIPSVAAHEEGELPAPPLPGVRYKGSADARVVYVRDLRGDKDYPAHEYASWNRGNDHFVPWARFVEFCGSAERAAEFIGANGFDFALENVELEIPDEDEFDVGGSV